MPVRKIPISHSSLTGRHAATGSNRSIAFESSLERDFITLIQFEPTTLNIEEQPVRINYDHEGKSRHYTPDFLVHRSHDKPMLAEIKPAKFLTPELEPKFNAARAYSKTRDWEFSIWTEKDIRTERLKNARFLLPFINREIEQNLKKDLLNQLKIHKSKTIGGLLEIECSLQHDISPNLAALWHLIAVRQIHADLDIELTPNSEIRFKKGA